MREKERERERSEAHAVKIITYICLTVTCVKIVYNVDVTCM